MRILILSATLLKHIYFHVVGLRLWTGFLTEDWIYWPLIYTTRNTSNYSAVANLHMSQIIRAPAKYFSACVFTVEILQLPALKSPLNVGSLPNAFFLHRLPCRTDLIARITFLVTPWDGPCRKHHFQQYLYLFMRIWCCGKVFTVPLPRIGFGIFAYFAVVAS
jgi:hypothetical protein